MVDDNTVQVVDLETGVIYRLTPENAGDAVNYGAYVPVSDGSDENRRATFEYLSVLEKKQQDLDHMISQKPLIKSESQGPTGKKFVRGAGVVQDSKTRTKRKGSDSQKEVITPEAQAKLDSRVQKR